MEAPEHPPDVRVIIDADHLAFATAHEVGHALVVLERKIHTITGGLPVRRVHVMEGMGAVVAFRTFKQGELFDVGAGQALPGGREVFLDPQRLMAGPVVAVTNVCPVTLPANAWCCR